MTRRPQPRKSRRLLVAGLLVLPVTAVLSVVTVLTVDRDKIPEKLRNNIAIEALYHSKNWAAAQLGKIEPAAGKPQAQARQQGYARKDRMKLGILIDQGAQD